MEIVTTPSSWPAVLVGLLIGAYWLRVLQMVLHTKRTAGRAANLIPPEHLGRLLRIIWIPVVGLWIAIPLALPFVRGLPLPLRPLTYTGCDVVGWVAVAVTGTAFAITWICWIRMGTSWRMGIDPNERTTLVVDGPFAVVRHPIYGLSQVMMVATLAAWPSPLMLLVAALHVFFMQWEVRREDRYLAALHGSAYADYIQQTGRFIPRLARWK